VFSLRLLQRFAALSAALCVALTWTSVASAQDVDLCIESSASGQELRDQGDLIAAEQEFVQCASNACPELIRKDCQNWLSELGPSIPSIRLKFDGEFAAEGRVLLDGRELGVSDAAIRVNPGSHEVKWEIKGRETSTTPVTIGVGSLGKVVVLKAGPKIERVTSEPSFDISQVPPVSLILGGVGVFALGSFAVLGIVSRSNYDSLSNRCMSRCSPDEVAPTRDMALAADLSLVFGIAALGAGTALYFVLDEESPHSAPTVAIGAGPTPSGASLNLFGRF
jgi:hypothetical protein